MEGLLPMVYKTIKRSRTPRHYEHLSSGAAHVSDVYANDYGKPQHYYEMAPPQKNDRGFGAEGKVHRRCNSIHVDYLGRFPPEKAADSRKLVRFRSHKRLFSCVTGV